MLLTFSEHKVIETDERVVGVKESVVEHAAEVRLSAFHHCCVVCGKSQLHL